MLPAPASTELGNSCILNGHGVFLYGTFRLQHGHFCPFANIISDASESQCSKYVSQVVFLLLSGSGNQLALIQLV